MVTIKIIRDYNTSFLGVRLSESIDWKTRFSETESAVLEASGILDLFVKEAKSTTNKASNIQESLAHYISEIAKSPLRYRILFDNTAEFEGFKWELTWLHIACRHHPDSGIAVEIT